MVLPIRISLSAALAAEVDASAKETVTATVTRPNPSHPDGLRRAAAPRPIRCGPRISRTADGAPLTACQTISITVRIPSPFCGIAVSLRSLPREPQRVIHCQELALPGTCTARNLPRRELASTKRCPRLDS